MASDVLRARTLPAGTDPEISGNTGDVRIDPSTGGLLVHIAGGGGSGGGGGGAVSIANGDDVALGARADGAASSDTASSSLIGLFKRSLQHLTELISGVSAHTSELEGVRSVLGDQDDAAATTDLGDASLISLLKRLLLTSRNSQIQAFASAARTVDATSPLMVNLSSRGCHVCFDLTAADAEIDLKPIIEVRDSFTNKWYPVLNGPQITELGTTILKVYPGIMAIESKSASDILPSEFRIRVVHSNVNSVTYSTTVSLVV